MCGLFGIAGKIETEKRAVCLSVLAALNESRGRESLGLATVGPDGKGRSCTLWKCPDNPLKGLRSEGFHRRAHDSRGRVWIGHTRQSTRGKVCKENAHPFRIGSTVGAHNGIVSNLHELRERLGLKWADDNFDVDSQYLIALMDKFDAVGEVQGCAALTVSRLKADEIVSLIRFDNPLSVATIGETANNGLACEALVWSSEEKALHTALAVAGLDGHVVDLKNKKRWNVHLTRQGTIAVVNESDAPLKDAPRAYHVTHYQGAESVSRQNRVWQGMSGKHHHTCKSRECHTKMVSAMWAEEEKMRGDLLETGLYTPAELATSHDIREAYRDVLATYGSAAFPTQPVEKKADEAIDETGYGYGWIGD